MKKIIALFLTLAMCISLLVGCGNTTTPTSKSDNKLKIVTTIYPEYDWVKQVLGDKAEQADITLLLDEGVDLHSYQPTTDDLMKISDCDLFIYVGGESDEWVEDALEQSKNKDMKVIKLLDVLGEKVKDEEIVEGMQSEEHHHDHDAAEEAHDHDNDATEKHEHDADEKDTHDHEHDTTTEETHEHDGEEKESDEHVWLSLQNAQKFVLAIDEALEAIDPDNASTYEKNATTYNAELQKLDSEYKKAVENAPQNTLLFGDRFPFRYLVDDYGVNYYAAFVGCSAETEASFETISFLAKKVDELHLNSILTIENSDKKIAETIKNNTASKNQKILTLNSMQSMTAKDIDGKASYLSIMKDNLKVLQDALA